MALELQNEDMNTVINTDKKVAEVRGLPLLLSLAITLYSQTSHLTDWDLSSFSFMEQIYKEHLQNA